MALIKRFKDFLLRNSIQNQDYIVGYDSDTGEEIRIKASALQGAAGKSADIQFSAEGDSWHYPITDGDLYIRIRIGSGAWNVARFVAEQPEVGSLSFSDESQELPIDSESFSEEITLHQVAKTGSYDDLADKPTLLTDIQEDISPSDFGALSLNADEIESVNSGETVDYLLADINGQIVKISLSDLADLLNNM